MEKEEEQQTRSQTARIIEQLERATQRMDTDDEPRGIKRKSDEIQVSATTSTAKYARLEQSSDGRALSDMPFEVLEHIHSFLTLPQALALRGVSRETQEIIRQTHRIREVAVSADYLEKNFRMPIWNVTAEGHILALDDLIDWRLVVIEPPYRDRDYRYVDEYPSGSKLLGSRFSGTLEYIHLSDSVFILRKLDIGKTPENSVITLHSEGGLYWITAQCIASWIAAATKVGGASDEQIAMIEPTLCETLNNTRRLPGVGSILSLYETRYSHPVRAFATLRADRSFLLQADVIRFLAVSALLVSSVDYGVFSVSYYDGRSVVVVPTPHGGERATRMQSHWGELEFIPKTPELRFTITAGGVLLDRYIVVTYGEPTRIRGWFFMYDLHAGGQRIHAFRLETQILKERLVRMIHGYKTSLLLAFSDAEDQDSISICALYDLVTTVRKAVRIHPLKTSKVVPAKQALFFIPNNSRIYGWNIVYTDTLPAIVQRPKSSDFLRATSISKPEKTFIS